MNTIAWLVTVIVILALGTYAAIQIQDYNNTCYMKFEGKTYYLCTE